MLLSRLRELCQGKVREWIWKLIKLANAINISVVETKVLYPSPNPWVDQSSWLTKVLMKMCGRWKFINPNFSVKWLEERIWNFKSVSEMHFWCSSLHARLMTMCHVFLVLKNHQKLEKKSFKDRSYTNFFFSNPDFRLFNLCWKKNQIT